MEPTVLVTLLFYRGSGLIDFGIRWQSRSEYAHVAIELPDGTVYEALLRKGVHCHRGAYPGVTKRLYVTLTVDQVAALRRALNAKVGHRYDWIGAARFVSRRRCFKNNRHFCSELIQEAFEEIGMPLQKRAEAWRLSPEHLQMSPLLRDQA